MTKNIHRSTEEKKFMRPWHAGPQLARRITRVWFYKGQQALVVERWLNRVEEDASGLTFEA